MAKEDLFRAVDREMDRIENDQLLSEEEKQEQVEDLEESARHEYEMDKQQMIEEYDRY